MEWTMRIAWPFSARSHRITSKVGFSGMAALNWPFQVLPINGRRGSSAVARLVDDSPEAGSEPVVRTQRMRNWMQRGIIFFTFSSAMDQLLIDAAAVRDDRSFGPKLRQVPPTI